MLLLLDFNHSYNLARITAYLQLVEDKTTPSFLLSIMFRSQEK